MASLLDEAADILRRLPEDVAERLQVRHWLPDELDGSSLMLRDCAAEQASTDRAMGNAVLVPADKLRELQQAITAITSEIGNEPAPEASAITAQSGSMMTDLPELPETFQFTGNGILWCKYAEATTYAKQVREQALEEAAKLVQDYDTCGDHTQGWQDTFAERIRALKDDAIDSAMGGAAVEGGKE
jgi:hypothetical protein